MAKKKQQKKRMGRPPIKIDWNLFDKLCALHCTQDEMSATLGYSVDTLDRRIKKKFRKTYAEYYKEKSAAGKVSLRRQLWLNATKCNNTTMQIWLSKQHLGMRDQPEQETNNDEININISVREKVKDDEDGE